DPEAEDEDSTAVTLRDLGLKVGAQFTYTYDFGDNWTHEIVVEGVHAVEHTRGAPRLPTLLDGVRAGPHEDSGGRSGYADMVRALRNKRHPEHRQYRDWAGPGYDPERFDPWLAGQNLALAAAWGAI
ncbi:MAG TPA: plasmid pRiA4b ORF-3 family protein, partial [Longimicrobium sp.]|nr:plasmid pRiA4b ORF-3 family protein [Longimicrobium sp.]